MGQLLWVLCSGILFGLGLSVSNMVNPVVVLNFLDFFGSWDPSLMFVMGGALVTFAIGFRFIVKRNSPVFDTEFHIPSVKDIDKKLILGSALFGIGWGMAGYCPGPAIAGLGYLQSETMLFVIALFVGFYVAKQTQKST